MNKIDKNLIWYANKWLHYFDMEYFKNIWYIEYDWGGLYLWKEDASRQNIDTFKLSFHPDLKDFYNYEKIPYILNSLYSFKQKIWKIIKEFV